MKKSLILLSLSCVSFMCAQTTIVEGVYTKESHPVSYQYLSESDNLAIFQGKAIGGMLVGDQENSIYTFDTTGKKNILFENEKLTRSTFSFTEKTIKMYDLTTHTMKPKFKFWSNGKFSALNDYDLDNRSLSNPFGINYFNDNKAFVVVREKNKFSTDLQKEEFKYSVNDISTGKKEIYTLQKPDLNRLVGPNFIELEEDLGYQIQIRASEGFDLITKSITKDYKKTILYATNYSTDGKIKGETTFTLELKDNVFLYSGNGAGSMRWSNGKSANLIFNDDLFINNYIVDQATGDVYVYGLYGDEAAKLNRLGKPVGYYIFKFDQKGNKIWESINKVVDKHFNGNNVLRTFEVSLTELNNSLCFSINVNENKEYVVYGLVEKTTGKVQKSSIIVYHQKMSGGFNTDFFIKSGNEIEDDKELKNKFFNPKTMIAMDSNPKINEYIRSKKSKNDLHFASIFSDKGIWLIETDNKEYYKVTLF